MRLTGVSINLFGRSSSLKFLLLGGSKFNDVKTIVLIYAALTFTVISQGQQVISDSLKIENEFRIFHFHKPKVDTRGFSLIFILHGSGNSGKQFIANIKDFEGIADQEKLITVFPDAYKKYWNECRKSSPAEANQLNLNENLFFSEMIEYFTSKYSIDPKRTHKTKLSK